MWRVWKSAPRMGSTIARPIAHDQQVSMRGGLRGGGEVDLGRLAAAPGVAQGLGQADAEAQLVRGRAGVELERHAVEPRGQLEGERRERLIRGARGVAAGAPRGPAQVEVEGEQLEVGVAAVLERVGEA